MIRAAGTILRKDLLLELRTKEAVPAMTLFTITVYVLFHFGLDRNAAAPAFTGEIGADSSTADAVGEAPDEQAAAGADKAKGDFGAERPEGKKSATRDAFDDEGSGQGFGSGHGRLGGSFGGGGSSGSW